MMHLLIAVLIQINLEQKIVGYSLSQEPITKQQCEDARKIINASVLVPKQGEEARWNVAKCVEIISQGEPESTAGMRIY